MSSRRAFQPLLHKINKDLHAPEIRKQVYGDFYTNCFVKLKEKLPGPQI